MKREVRRLTRWLHGERITIPQRSGPPRTFGQAEFWQSMFMDAANEVTGRGERSPVADAIQNATPEASAMVAALVESEGGDFLAGRGSESVEDDV